MLNQIQGVSLLYHEATFLDDKFSRAKKTFHSTAKQAADIAKLASEKDKEDAHQENRRTEYKIIK